MHNLKKGKKGSLNYLCRHSFQAEALLKLHGSSLLLIFLHLALFLFFTFLCLLPPGPPPFLFPAPTSSRRVEPLPACEDNHAVCSRLIQTGRALLGIAAPQLLASSSPAAPGLIRNKPQQQKKHSAMIHPPPLQSTRVPRVLVWIYPCIVLLALETVACV